MQKFKGLVERPQPAPMFSILGQDQDSHFVQPPLSMDEDMESPVSLDPHKNHSLDIYDRNSKARDLVVSGAHDPGVLQRQRAAIDEDVDNTSPSMGVGDSRGEKPSGNGGESPSAMTSRTDTPTKTSISEGTRGHARDPLQEEHLYLFIGPSTYSAPPTCPTSRSGSLRHDGDHDSTIPPLEIDTSVGVPIPGSETPIDMSAVPIVSESPGATDIDVYETAYSEEIDRIRSRSRDSHNPEPTMYLTRRMERNRARLNDVLRLLQEAEEKDKNSSVNENETEAQQPPSAALDTEMSKDSDPPAPKPIAEENPKPVAEQPTTTTSQPAPTAERKSSVSISSSSTDASKSAARRSKTGLRGLVGRLRGKSLGKDKDAGDGGE